VNYKCLLVNLALYNDSHSLTLASDWPAWKGCNMLMQLN